METKIRVKLEELSKQKEQLLSQLNAILGAEQVLKQLLDDKDVKPDEQ